jgi:poly(3-hydroxybutyrate) depolymerase
MKKNECTPFRSLLTVCFLLLCCSVRSQAPTHTGKFSPYIDNNVNGFWEYLPRNYDADVNARYPLLVFFHGAGEQGDDQSTTTLDKVLRAGPPKLINSGNFPDSFFVAGQWHKFIVISPQIKNGIVGVSSTIQPSTVEAVIQYALSAYRVDATRIYLCGLSMGGGAVWDYAGSSLNAAQKLAAIAVAAGAADLTMQQANNIAEGDLPVLATHNKDDNIIAQSRTEANIAAIQSYSPSITPKPVYWDLGGHNVWRRTYEDILPGSTPNGNLRDTLGRNIYEWFLENFRPAVVLPVTWQSFTVRAQNAKAHLQWIVSNQVNVKEYVIEKSSNGTGWVTVATIAAKPDLTYSFIDAATTAGTTFYRIKQSDNNGRSSYSSVKTFDLNGIIKTLVYPNPFRSFIKIDADIPPGNITIRLIDRSGKTVFSNQQLSGNGEIIVTGLELLPAATYYLSIQNNDGKPILRTQLLKIN